MLYMLVVIYLFLLANDLYLARPINFILSKIPNPVYIQISSSCPHNVLYSWFVQTKLIALNYPDLKAH